MISISISPNIEKDDLFLTLRLIFQPSKWKKGDKEEELKGLIKEYFNIPYVSLFNSGRSALYCLLRAFNLKKKDEVLIQAFTCNALVNPILWNNFTPVYVDIDSNLNIDPLDLRKKITTNSKILIVQHTFGNPCKMEEILKVVKENNLILIEDCAHSLGAEYKGQKIGTFGKASFLSFSRDKVISSVYGGAILIKDKELAEKILELDYPSNFWTFQQLLHPLLIKLIIPCYNFLGKALLIFFQRLHILSKAVSYEEKQGKKPKYFPKKMPNAIACLACNQFKKLDKFYLHRKKISEIYSKELGVSYLEKDVKKTYLRFIFFHEKAHEIIRKFWKRNILIGDWYTSPIAPPDTNLERMKYKLGSCKKAEKYAKKTLNLPTHINISKKQAKYIVSILRELIK